jgi:hypothetical protein
MMEQDDPGDLPIGLLVFLFLRSASRLRNRLALPLGDAPLGTRVNAHQHRVYWVSGSHFWRSSTSDSESQSSRTTLL